MCSQPVLLHFCHEANKPTASVCACSTIRNNNLRLAVRSSSCSKDGQSQPEKPPKWLLQPIAAGREVLLSILRASCAHQSGVAGGHL